MRAFGGVVSFQLAEGGYAAVLQLMQRLRLFAVAESLGGVESLCAHPATMSHSSLTADERRHLGIADTLLRLSVGVEAADDLIEDLRQALG